MKRLILTMLLASAVGLPACSSNRAELDRTPRMLKSVIGGPAEGSGDGGRASTAVWGADRGLEIWTWTVADARSSFTPNPGSPDPAAKGDSQEENGQDTTPKPPTYTIIDPRLSIEQAFAPYIHRAPPIDDDLRFRLQAAGFRVLAVPVADLASLQASLRLVAPTQKQWLGEAPMWTDVIQGPAFERGRTFAIENSPSGGTSHLPAGRLRLLGRAWIAPLPVPDHPLGAALRLELAPQHEPTLSEPYRLLAGANRTSADAEGRIFPRLSMAMYLRGDLAILIVPDSPENDWAAAGERESESHQEPSAGDEHRVAWPTLGEAMLSSTESGRRTRAVIVLIPRVPERFELR